MYNNMFCDIFIIKYPLYCLHSLYISAAKKYNSFIEVNFVLII